jgi:hypothetical protein
VPIPDLVDREVHRIDEVLADSWLDDFIAQGVAGVEEYLAKHAAFDAFLEDRD